MKISLILLAIFLSGCGVRLGYPDSPTAPATSESESKKKYRIFVTAATTDGLIGTGGINGADSFCNVDTNKPTTGTYKAMLVDGSTRIAVAGSQVGWVLKASTTYTRTDGTVIGTTNSNALFPFSLNAGISGFATRVHTGLDTDWDTTSHCTGWTVNNTDPVAFGQANYLTSGAIFFGTDSCSSLLSLYCVEQ